MSRWIDADAVKITYRGGHHDDFMVDYDSFINAPSIDIVRCVECKYSELDCCQLHKRFIKSDDFCSYGERRK